MANPTQFTMVNAVPLYLGIAFCATNVENKGESAITTIPQKIKKLRSINSELVERIKGDNKQQIHDSNNAENATFFVCTILHILIKYLLSIQLRGKSIYGGYYHWYSRSIRLW